MPLLLVAMHLLFTKPSLTKSCHAAFNVLVQGVLRQVLSFWCLRLGCSTHLAVVLAVTQLQGSKRTDLSVPVDEGSAFAGSQTSAAALP